MQEPINRANKHYIQILKNNELQKNDKLEKRWIFRYVGQDLVRHSKVCLHQEACMSQHVPSYSFSQSIWVIKQRL